MPTHLRLDRDRPSLLVLKRAGPSEALARYQGGWILVHEGRQIQKKKKVRGLLALEPFLMQPWLRQINPLRYFKPWLRTAACRVRGTLG